MEELAAKVQQHAVIRPLAVMRTFFVLLYGICVIG